MTSKKTLFGAQIEKMCSTCADYCEEIEDNFMPEIENMSSFSEYKEVKNLGVIQQFEDQESINLYEIVNF